MEESNFIIEIIDESILIEAFSHIENWDSGSNGFYSSPLTGIVSHEELIRLFMEEVLEGEQFIDEFNCISQKKADQLLRQMAMFEFVYIGSKSKERKVRQYTNSEAKLASRLLLEFLGSSAEFYTNVRSTEFPHENPGTVMAGDSEGSHKEIAFVGINQSYFLYFSQLRFENQ